jgi:NDP-sugar pyrophosphorylase family protein
MGKTIAYVQAGGFGSRLAPLAHQPGLMNSVKALSKDGRNLLPFNHNSYYAVAKPMLPYFGVSLSEPLIKRAVSAGVKEVRMTIHNIPETVVRYYTARDLGGGVTASRFLYETTPLGTAGGIVRDVVAGIRNGFIDPADTVLILGGDIRTDLDLADFLGAHESKQADLSILLAEVLRQEMFRFGAAVRQGDECPVLGNILIQDPKSPNKEITLDVFGEFKLIQEKMARIARFYEKLPRLVGTSEVEDENGNRGKIIAFKGVNLQQALNVYGQGALSPTNMQNGSICAVRAELIAQLAPLVFNLSLEATAREWAETEDINASGESKFSDLAGDLFMVLTGSKPYPKVSEFSPVQETQQRIIDDLSTAPPQIFGYRHDGNWSDDGTLRAVLEGHFAILKELVEKKHEASWPIRWDKVRMGPPYPRGILTMSNFDPKEVNIEGPAFIGPDVILRPGAEIGPYSIINGGWDIYGKISHSVLLPKKKIDKLIEEGRNWNRFTVPRERIISGSIIGSGFEINAIDEKGEPKNMNEIIDKIVVSNGSQNVISPIDI